MDRERTAFRVTTATTESRTDAEPFGGFMSTIDHQNSAKGSKTDRDGARVLPLNALKRRQRLEGLFATRSHLAAIAAQQRSHGLDDAEESFSLQMVVESTIRDEFPQEYEANFALWLEADVEGEHPTGVLTANCGICRSIATSHGLNFEPPEAA